MNSFPVVLAGRGLEGLAAAFFLPASTALLLDVFPLAERGGAQGKMMMISMVHHRLRSYAHRRHHPGRLLALCLPADSSCRR